MGKLIATTKPARAGEKETIMTIDCRANQMTHTNPVRVIRQRCLDCSCGSYTEVDLCTVKECALWPWRYGKNPYRKKRELSDEQREAAKVRLQTARKNVHA